MGRKSVKPRKAHIHLGGIQTGDLSPHERLAVAIIEQAVADTKTVLAGANTWPLWLVSRWELVNFFKSKWCATLLGTTNLDGNEIAERLGLYGR